MYGKGLKKVLKAIKFTFKIPAYTLIIDQLLKWPIKLMKVTVKGMEMLFVKNELPDCSVRRGTEVTMNPFSHVLQP